MLLNMHFFPGTRGRPFRRRQTCQNLNTFPYSSHSPRRIRRKFLHAADLKVMGPFLHILQLRKKLELQTRAGISNRDTRAFRYSYARPDDLEILPFAENRTYISLYLLLVFFYCFRSEAGAKHLRQAYRLRD